MSWSISLIGKPANIIAALDGAADQFTGQSRLEFEAALPALKALAAENFADEDHGFVLPTLRLDASGSGSAVEGAQLHRSLIVKLEPFYARLV